ncbi:MAG: hypothetical protein Q9170_005884 [Blastenia crenularia]
MFNSREKAPGLPQLKLRSKRFPARKIIITVAVVAILLIAIAVGLGVGLTRNDNSNEDTTATKQGETQNATSANTTVSKYNGWQPANGTTWQIELQNPLENITLEAEVFDIDLFNNTAASIADLQSESRKVICYFSAGSYEEWNPDVDQFEKEFDLGQPLDGWPGEWWLNTKSKNVRRIMSARLDLAVEKGCDGVDPDNVDAYDNDNGLDLTTSDAIDYVKFLADAAHGRNLSIGLKNALAIIPQVEPRMQWSVNEQCVQYNECAAFRAFIDHDKPVFHIEYPDDAPSISDDDKLKYCNNDSAEGFSTALKKMDLDDWIYACPRS